MNYLKIEEEPRFIETIKILASKVSSGSKVIEIGASDASFKDYVNGKDWLTVDKFGNPDLVADLNNRKVSLPIETGTIDIVICTEVLEHLAFGGSLVKEIARILKSEGRAMISVPNIVSLKSRLKVLFGSLPISSASGDCGPDLRGQGILVNEIWEAGHVIDFNAWRLEKYLNRGGLKLIKHWKMPLGIRVLGRNHTIPAFLIPKTLTDIIFFEVSPLIKK